MITFNLLQSSIDDFGKWFVAKEKKNNAESIIQFIFHPLNDCQNKRIWQEEKKSGKEL